MFRRYLILIFLFVFIFSVSLAQAKNENVKQVKLYDPLLAGVLSWYTAGLGQFYTGQYFKGTVFWFVDNALFISTILTVADITFSMNKDIGFQFNIKPKEYISKSQKTIAITLLVSYSVFHIYNIIDAIQSVKHINREILKNKNKKLSFNFKIDKHSSSVNINYRF